MLVYSNFARKCIPQENAVEGDFRKEYRGTMIFCIAMSFVLVLNYFLSNDYLALSCTIVASAKLFICREKELLPLSIYFSYLAYLFRFQKYNIYVFVCLAFIVRVTFLKKDNFLFTIIGIPLYFIVHLFSSTNVEFTIGDLIPLFSVMILMYACGVYNEKYRDVCIYFFIVGHVVTSVLGLLRNISRLNIILNTTFVSVHSFRDSLRFSGLSYDPNFYTVTAAITLCILLLGFGYRIKTLKWFVATTITISFGLITYSKSMIFCFITIIAFSLFKAEHKTRLRILKMLPIFIILCLIFRRQLFGIYETLMVRLDGADTAESLTTGRTNLWKMYYNDIFKSTKSFLIGNGIVQYFTSAAHNTYLEILHKFGFIGAITEVIYLWGCNRRIGYRFTLSLNSLFIILILAALLFCLSAYTFYGLWSCLFIVMILVRKENQYAENFDNNPRL